MDAYRRLRSFLSKAEGESGGHQSRVTSLLASTGNLELRVLVRDGFERMIVWISARVR